MDKNNPFIKIIFPNGDQYTGESKNGKMHGKGKLILSNGDKYEGEFKDDRFDGQGTYTFSRTLHHYTEGNYTGIFKDGKRNGQGILIFKRSMSYLNQDYDSEVQYVGSIETYSESEQYLVYGEKYVGEFKNNIFYGNEVEYGLDELNWDNHSVYAAGLWKDDKFLVKPPITSTEIIYPDYLESDNFAEESEQIETDNSSDAKEVILDEENLQENNKPCPMTEFSVPNMIDELEIIPRLKQIPGLTITRYVPPVA